MFLSLVDYQYLSYSKEQKVNSLSLINSYNTLYCLISSYNSLYLLINSYNSLFCLINSYNSLYIPFN